MGVTDIDFDEALRSSEETKRRLAGGQRLRLVKAGRPFAILEKPEDLELFLRESNPGHPPAAQLPPLPDDLRALLESRPAPRGPVTVGELMRRLESSTILQEAMSRPESVEYFKNLRGRR